jgi:hypothetical protein
MVPQKQGKSNVLNLSDKVKVMDLLKGSISLVGIEHRCEKK